MLATTAGLLICSLCMIEWCERTAKQRPHATTDDFEWCPFDELSRIGGAVFAFGSDSSRKPGGLKVCIDNYTLNLGVVQHQSDALGTEVTVTIPGFSFDDLAFFVAGVQYSCAQFGPELKRVEFAVEGGAQQKLDRARFTVIGALLLLILALAFHRLSARRSRGS